MGIAAVWGNIATTFHEATLYSDARVTFERANAMAATIEEEAPRLTLRLRALHGIAACALYLHEYLAGLEACEEAIALIHEPKDREQEQVRALVESTYTQLLLAVNRTEEASLMRPSRARWRFAPVRRGRRSPLRR